MRRWKHRRKVVVWLLLIMFLNFCLHPLTDVTVRAEETGKRVASLNPDFDTVISDVYFYLKEADTDPGYGSIWRVIGLTRSTMGVSSSYHDTFYKNIYTYLEQNQWVLTKTTYSNYSKLILSLTAVGIDAQNIGGRNLLAYLSDFSNVTKQGFMGPLWALMAVRCHSDYTIPAGSTVEDRTTEKKLVEYLLEHQLPAGGWTLQGEEADVDVTAMTIQALSSYYGERSDVKEAIDKAVDVLASMQQESGGYGMRDDDGVSETAESAAQVITALSSIGIDAAEDPRFAKADGSCPLSGLFQFYRSEGGFAHVAGGSLNAIATEQGMYAMTAYQRFKDGKTFLYDMNDISLSSGKVIQVSSPTDSTQPSTNGNTTTYKIPVTQIVLDYASLTIVKGKTKSLTAVVNPSSATNRKIKWTSSVKKVATVTQKGKIKAVKEGSTVIKAKATDGSGLSATCVVKVVSSSGNSKSTSTGSTKTLNSTGTGTTKRLGNASDSQNTTATKTGDTASQGGWSFSGEDYVPENTTSENTWDTSFAEMEESGEKDSGQGTRWEDKTITIQIPMGRIFYMGVGGTLLLVIEGVVYLIQKKRKRRMNAQ